MSVDSVEQELRDMARLHVRAGLATTEQTYETMVAAISEQMPQTDPAIMARAWLAAARKEWVAEAANWSVPTDHDRVIAALAECDSHGVPVLLGAVDQWAAKAHMDAYPASEAAPLRGVIWCSVPEVWHAIESGTLELSLRHANGVGAAFGDPLATAVLGCLARHGLQARFERGLVLVATRWRRRPD